MSTWSPVPLQSLALAPYTEQLSCYVCDAGNRFDGDFCRQCHAPLALAYATDRKQRPPELVAVLGAAGVGKTTYLGLLTDMLSRRQGDIQITARGAFSVSLQQHAIASLAHRRFPAPTPVNPEGWSWVHGEVRLQRAKRSLEVIMSDESGTATCREIDAPQSQPAIRRILNHGTAALILVDAAALDRGEQEAEFAAVKTVSDLLAYVPPKKRPGWRERPVAMLFTKADRCDWAFEAPADFARRRAPGLWRLCQDHLRRTEFFATSVATVHTAIDRFGDRYDIPLRVEPRGVVEPFAWMVNALAK